MDKRLLLKPCVFQGLYRYGDYTGELCQTYELWEQRNLAVETSTDVRILRHHTREKLHHVRHDSARSMMNCKLLYARKSNLCTP